MASSDKPPESKVKNVDEEDALNTVQENLYREALLRQHLNNYGGKFKPFNIEPFHYDRQRLSGAYTNEDRKLRKQWLHDQVLSEREPLKSYDAYPMNIFRKMFVKPCHAIVNLLEPMIGHRAADFGRVAFHRFAFVFGASWFLYYWIKYYDRSWETSYSGLNYMSPVKPAEFPDEINPETNKKNTGDFNDRGFRNRTIFKDNIRTSTEISWKSSL